MARWRVEIEMGDKRKNKVMSVMRDKRRGKAGTVVEDTMRSTGKNQRKNQRKNNHKNNHTNESKDRLRVISMESAHNSEPGESRWV